MDQIELTTASRDVLGKKVRFLRRDGIIPLHLFGHNIESLALQCDEAQLKQVLARAGKTRLINLKVDKGKRSKSVVVREVQKDMRTNKLLHVDLYQIKMAEKIRVDVPVVVTGEAPALQSKENILIQEFNTLSVECLPSDIPTHIRIDVNSLTERDQAIQVMDVVLDEGVTILNAPELAVVRISLRPKVKVEEVVTEEEAVEEIAEAAEALEETTVPEEEQRES